MVWEGQKLRSIECTKCGKKKMRKSLELAFQDGIEYQKLLIKRL